METRLPQGASTAGSYEEHRKRKATKAMNRSFLIIFIPALFVAAGYLYIGVRPPLRAEVALGIFVAAIAAVRLKAMLDSRKSPAPAARPNAGQPPAALPPGTQVPPAPQAANHH